MNKKEICAALVAAGIAFDGKLPVADLKALAEANGISTERVGKTPVDPAAAELLKTAYYDGMRQDKVTAGLALDAAIEVTARQRDEDEANGYAPYLETPTEELPED